MNIKLEFPEGSTPLNDCSGLKLKWVQNQKDLDRAEAENIALAQKLYLKRSTPDPRRWFAPLHLKAVHQKMFGIVWDWAGCYRKEVTSIGIKPYLIPSQVAAFCNEVVAWSNEVVELSFLERSAIIHHRLVSIHPFENGNGRFSRLIADRYLLAWGLPHPYWPIDIQRNGENRAEYIGTLKEADAGSYDSLIKLMVKLGAKEPSIKELSSAPLYKKRLNRAQLEAIEKAVLRNNAS